MPFSDRPRAVVTGAASGLGRAFCQELTRRGARIVAADIDVEGVRQTVGLLPAGSAHALRCDVSILSDVEELAEETERLLGGVDLVINNAGVAAGGRIGELPLSTWEWIVGINLLGPIHGCHVFAPRLRRQRSGHILNVASAAGLFWSPNLGPYNVTKAGVVALTETLRTELAADGVGVSVLCPTFFQTKIADSARTVGDPAMLDMVRGLMARAKIQADDVARIALDHVQRNELYILPHADGRWMWRLKRLLPATFNRITQTLLSMRAQQKAR